jgi:hypothetical protein
MNKFEHKMFILFLNGENLSLQAISPTTHEELIELHKLDRKGLCKFMIIDTSFSYILHKRIAHKLVKDFTSNDNPTIEFVDRSKNSHGLLQIHASNITNYLYKKDQTIL